MCETGVACSFAEPAQHLLKTTNGMASASWQLDPAQSAGELLMPTANQKQAPQQYCSALMCTLLKICSLEACAQKQG